MINADVTERDAERMLCGIAICRPDKANEIKDAVAADDFGDLMLRSIFVAAMSSIGKTGTTDVLATSIEHGKLYPGRDASLEIVGCAEKYTGAALPAFYCEQVREYAQRRRMREVADELIRLSMQGDADVADAITDAKKRLTGIEHVQGEIKTIGEVMYETLDYAERLAKGKIVPVLSGLEPLDRITGGFYPGELTYIGALPSVGKSAAAIMVSLAAPKQGKQVLFASAEMDTIQMGQRVFSDTANVNATRIRKPKTLTEKDWDAMGAALGEWNDKPVRYIFERNLERIIANVRRQRERGECDVLMLDYVQLLTTNARFSQDRLRVEYISHELHALAKEINVPVIALAQLTRPPHDDRAIPRIRDFGDSSAIERDADMAVLLHRPEYPDDDIFKQDGFKDDVEVMARLQGTGKRLTYLIVGKQRMGPTAICTTVFDGAHNRFAALER
jgi:replicative DNA helicase